MREVDSRVLGDGSQTTITLFWDGADRFVVEAVNARGTSSADVTAAEAGEAFKHPFIFGLDYPGMVAAGTESRRPYTDHELELLAALNVEVEA